MNFYQSPLRTTLTKDIYKKPTFTVEVAWKEYQGIVKIQRKLGKTLRRFMVHGVEVHDTSAFYAPLKEAMDHLKRDYAKWRGDIFFQLGFYNELDSRSTKELGKQEVIQELVKKRQYQQADFWQRYDLRASWREHMPNATIVVDVRRSLEALRSELSDSCKRAINKCKRAELVFERAETKEQWEAYWEVWYSLSFDKWFAVLPKETFLRLMEYITAADTGVLRLATKDWKIVSGAVYLLYEKKALYLYGATDRSFGHLGAQYRLTWEIVQRAKDHAFDAVDLLGIAPTGADASHPRNGVTRFKQSFWWTTINYVGNYDLVFHPLLYKTRTLLKK